MFCKNSNLSTCRFLSNFERIILSVLFVCVGVGGGFRFVSAFARHKSRCRISQFVTADRDEGADLSQCGGQGVDTGAFLNVCIKVWLSVWAAVQRGSGPLCDKITKIFTWWFT